MSAGLELGVSDFVALLNQTLEYAYPDVTVRGELANMKVSKNRWVYFDLKDDMSTVRFFGTVYQLPGPLDNGMLVAVRGMPRVHTQYGFSVHVMSIRPVGEGSIKKAAALLEAKLAAEGLFEADRKRVLPYPPARIGLITSAESAAYRDFIKVLADRWGGMEIILIDTQVQGEVAPGQIVAAVEQLNQMADPPDVLVVTRGGGSAEDLAAFNTEQVTRAVAASRVPTLVAIGHEIDVSLSELAADRRASTPSNAAELLVPDRSAVVMQARHIRERLAQGALHTLQLSRQTATRARSLLQDRAELTIAQARKQLVAHRQLLAAYDPAAVLRRGYAIVRAHGAVLRSGADTRPGEMLDVTLADARMTVEVKHVTMKGENI